MGEALDRNRIAFHVSFSNNTLGIFVATISIREDLDRDGDVDSSDLALLLAA